VVLLSSRGGGGGGGGAGGGGSEAGELVRAKVAAKAAPEGKAESLETFPEALGEEDDDLPF